MQWRGRRAISLGNSEVGGSGLPGCSHRPRRCASSAAPATFWVDLVLERVDEDCTYKYRLANMDPLKLLSRSTKLQKKQAVPGKNAQLPSGQQARPQLYASERNGADESASKKRKRGQATKSHGASDSTGPDFFGGASRAVESSPPPPQLEDEDLESEDDGANPNVDEETEEEARKILKQHKLKMTWLNPQVTSKKSKKKAKESKKEQNQHVYPRPLERFHTLRKRFAIPQRVQENVSDQGYDLATEVQMAALPLLLDNPNSFLHAPDGQEVAKHESSYIDLLAVAPTGSGKTLAFLIPLFSKIMRLRKEQSGSRHTTAVILAPTKELVGQIVNEGKKLGLNTGTKISQVRKGMNLDHFSAPGDDASEVKTEEDSSVKVDILVSTPGVLHSILEDKENQDRAALPAVESLVLDEADVLLDPLFREQTLAIWHRLSHPDLRVSLWSATMGSNIEDLARATIAARQKRLADEKNLKASDAPLVRLVVGLKDSAVPNIQHKLIYAATEQGKLMGLRQLLHPTTSSAESGPPLRPPFLVFTQTIERAVALHSELLYDIPAEAGGISRIAVLHSDLSDTARDSVMTRFRKGEVWVLITTDLLSRGVDFRGVNGVVNYDIPTSSAAYVHRVGRTGRAGRQGGVAVTLYSKEDIPYMKHVATVVSMAQKQQGAAAGEGVQQWLLDALPSLSKNDKQKFKKRGVEVRTARGMASDPRGAKKARISTKAGYVRREENKKKGAIAGSKQRAKLQPKEEAGDGSDFGGFD